MLELRILEASLSDSVLITVLRFILSGTFIIGSIICFVLGAVVIAVLEMRNGDSSSASESVGIMFVVYILILCSLLVFRHVYGANLGLV